MLALTREGKTKLSFFRDFSFEKLSRHELAGSTRGTDRASPFLVSKSSILDWVKLIYPHLKPRISPLRIPVVTAKRTIGSISGYFFKALHEQISWWSSLSVKKRVRPLGSLNLLIFKHGLE